ncbi:MAG: ACP S-malonyltransferase [Litorilinea sp.]
MHGFRFIQHLNQTALLFPGQGSQVVGMGQAIAEAYPAAKAVFEEADAILGAPLSKLCFEGPGDELTDTINAQPALLVTSVALMRAIDEELGKQAGEQGGVGGPVYVAGHSLGEYTALVAAGALTFADAVRLVRERGRVMKAAGQKTPGLMAAVLGLDEEVIAQVCAEAAAGKGVAVVANDNCPGQIVISGDRPGMEAAMPALEAAGAKRVVPLAVSIASHSPLMAPAAEALTAAIEATPVHAPQTPIVANTTADLLTSAAAIRAELAAQLTGGVRWTDSIRRALADGMINFVEIGPGDVLGGMVRRIDRSANRLAVGDPAGVAAFVAWLQES